mmetsp:Transcript_29945/g.73696  ORF Transcript_29945/g.73696 Transcript_29945/m.73696 type:complete len:300 (+) Transcript_29945:579-1478(+)
MRSTGSPSTSLASCSATSSRSRMCESGVRPLDRRSLIRKPSCERLRSVQIFCRGSILFSRNAVSTIGIVSACSLSRKGCSFHLGSSFLISPMQIDVSFSPKTRSPARSIASCEATATFSPAVTMGPRKALSLILRMRRSHGVSSRTDRPIVSLSISLPSTRPTFWGSLPKVWRMDLPSLESRSFFSICSDLRSMLSCASMMASAAFIAAAPVALTAGFSPTFWATFPTMPRPCPTFSPILSRAGLVFSSMTSARFFASSAARCAASYARAAAAPASSLAWSTVSRASLNLMSSACLLVI